MVDIENHDFSQTGGKIHATIHLVQQRWRTYRAAIAIVRAVATVFKVENEVFWRPTN